MIRTEQMLCSCNGDKMNILIDRLVTIASRLALQGCFCSLPDCLDLLLSDTLLLHVLDSFS